MTTFYLLNATLVGTIEYFPGETVDSNASPKAAIEAAGGICWPATDATVTAAALACQSLRKNRGVRDEDLQVRMFAAAHSSLAASSVLAATTSTPGLMSAAQFNALAAASPVYHARYVAFANVADRTAFVVAQDGVTGVAGDVVLLANQTTAAECGLYVLGTVAGTAPLTRIAALPAAAAYVNGCTVEVSEGTIFAGSTWKSMATGSKIVGTDDPLFYPRVSKGILTLASGTKTLGATEGLFLFSATKSVFHASMDTPGGVTTLTVGGYGFNSSGLTAGKSGTGAATCIARVAAGTIDAANNSTVAWMCTNW